MTEAAQWNLVLAKTSSAANGAIHSVTKQLEGPAAYLRGLTMLLPHRHARIVFVDGWDERRDANEIGDHLVGHSERFKFFRWNPYSSMVQRLTLEPREGPPAQVIERYDMSGEIARRTDRAWRAWTEEVTGASPRTEQGERPPASPNRINEILATAQRFSRAHGVNLTDAINAIQAAERGGSGMASADNADRIIDDLQRAIGMPGTQPPRPLRILRRYDEAKEAVAEDVQVPRQAQAPSFEEPKRQIDLED